METKFCIYGCGGSTRDSWDNSETATVNGETKQFVACDSHDSNKFASDVKVLVAAGVDYVTLVPKDFKMPEPTKIIPTGKSV